MAGEAISVLPRRCLFVLVIASCSIRIYAFLSYVPRQGALKRPVIVDIEPIHKDTTTFHSSSFFATRGTAITNNDDRSLKNLIEALDKRNIRYPPTATRHDLQRLLREHEEKKKQRQLQNNINDDDGLDDDDDDDATILVRSRLQALSLTDLIQELDRQGIRYPPTASRSDLERLLYEQEEKELHRGKSSQQQQQQQQQEPQPIQEILNQLDDKNIRYPSTATRVELEQLLETHRRYNNRSENAQFQTTKERQTTTSRPQQQQQVDRRRRPIGEILKELDEKNIRYPPTATRTELELLLKSHRLDNAADKEPYASSPQLLDRQKRRSRRRRQRQHQQQQEPPLSPILEQVSRKASQTVDYAARKARQVSRKAVDLWSVDNDGVRDVDYTYVYRDHDVDTGRQRFVASPSRRKVSPSQYRRSPSTSNNGSSTAYKRTRPIVVPEQNVTTRLALPSAAAHSEHDEQPRTAPSSQAQTNNRTSASRRQRRRRPFLRERKIYSPYNKETTAATLNGRDSLDRFGDFVANAADTILWGPEEDADTFESRDDDDFTARDADAPTDEGEKSRRQQKKKKHWKDRLEERLDYMLGIHENGAYYNSWADKTEEERRNEGGYDVFSVAEGRQPKQRRRRVSKEQKSDKPFWEEEGNLVSLLFGRTPSGGSLLFERLLDDNSGSLVNLFRVTFKSVLLVASYLCRWASVQGSLPQPVVVVGVMAAGLSARPRHRLKAIAIALVALRTVGELVHGYAYENDDWEDDFESDLDKEDDEARR